MEQDAFIRLRGQWEEKRDPRYIWRVIATCANENIAMPLWVAAYLIEVAEGVEAGKKFPQKKPGAPIQIDSLIPEQFGIAFIREILNGVTAGKARENAASATGLSPDGKELSQRLKDFFGIKTLPNGRQQWRWKLIVAGWLLNHPEYVERYPDPPTEFKFPGGLWGGG